MPTLEENPAAEAAVWEAEVVMPVQLRAVVEQEMVEQRVVAVPVQQREAVVQVVPERVVAAVQRVEAVLVQAVAERKFLSMIVETHTKGH